MCSGSNKNSSINFLVEKLKEFFNSFKMNSCISTANPFNKFLDPCFANHDFITCSVSAEPLRSFDVFYPAFIFKINTIQYRNLKYFHNAFDFKKADYMGQMLH